MSTTASIGNFYVDHNGVEQPIVFAARDLVNRPAPEGYHWEMDVREWTKSREATAESRCVVRKYRLACMRAALDKTEFPPQPDEVYWQFPNEKPSTVDAYICVKD